MLYRRFGKTEEMVSPLIFGTMIYPVSDANDPHSIIYSEAESNFMGAFNNGANFFDTSFVYHSKSDKEQGKSEEVTGKIIKNNGIRSKIKLATKLPSWQIQTIDDAERVFEKQLHDLQTDYIDFYLLHCITKDNFEQLSKIDIFKWLDKLKSSGAAKHVGFSFHDEFPIFEQTITAYDWSFCYIPLNYLDQDSQAGLKGLQMAIDRDMGVGTVQSLKRDRLSHQMPLYMKKKFEEHGFVNFELAYKWLLSRYENLCPLTELTDMDEIKEQIKFMESIPDISNVVLTDLESGVLETVRNLFISKTQVDCDSCNKCLEVCPEKINIPTIFSYYNSLAISSELSIEKLLNREENISYADGGFFGLYHKLSKKASDCTACFKCEKVCHKKLPIVDEFKKIQKLYEPSIK